MYKIYIPFIVVFLLSCDTREIKRDRFFLRGNVALDENDYRKAIKFYTNALSIDPDYALAYNNRGVAKMEDDRPFEAIQDYNQAILIDPQYWEAIANRANAYESTRKYTKSLQDIRTLTAAFPDSLLFRFQEGIVLTHLDSLDQAARVFQYVWDHDGADVEALINLAIVRYYQQEYETAIRLLEEALGIDPSQANAYNTLNQLFSAIQSHNLALQAIAEALALDPSNPVYLNNRGYTYLMMDSLRQAITDINASLVRDPENMWAFRNKGIYFLKKKDYEQAERYLLRAAQSRPYVPQSYTWLAKLYEETGQPEKAIQMRENESDGHLH